MNSDLKILRGYINGRLRLCAGRYMAQRAVTHRHHRYAFRGGLGLGECWASQAGSTAASKVGRSALLSAGMTAYTSMSSQAGGAFCTARRRSF